MIGKSEALDWPEDRLDWLEGKVKRDKRKGWTGEGKGRTGDVEEKVGLARLRKRLDWQGGGKGWSFRKKRIMKGWLLDGMAGLMAAGWQGWADGCWMVRLG